MNARRRSRRSRTKNPADQGSASQTSQRASGDSSKKRSRRKATPKPADLTAFWGDRSALPAVSSEFRITADATAVVRSLGRPPLAGHETAAEHYLEPIYNRAVMLASALGAAGDLVEPEDLV